MGTVDENSGLPRILLQSKSCQMADAFLLQFVSILCLSNSMHTKDDKDDAVTVRLQDRFDAAARDAKKLTEFLLKLVSETMIVFVLGLFCFKNSLRQ